VAPKREGKTRREAQCARTHVAGGRANGPAGTQPRVRDYRHFHRGIANLGHKSQRTCACRSTSKCQLLISQTANFDPAYATGQQTPYSGAEHLAEYPFHLKKLAPAPARNTHKQVPWMSAPIGRRIARPLQSAWSALGIPFRA